MNELLTLFTRASKLLRAAADDAMSAHGVRVGQNIVLEALWDTDGLTPGQIAQRVGLTTPTVVNTTTRMEGAGLVVRRPDPHDARLVRVHLTEHGLSVRGVIEAERDGLARRATAGLTKDERRHLHTSLQKIINQLTDDPDAPPG
jgi:MarR family transcriptional regulator, organic hydroperoxide resistance regulator